MAASKNNVVERMAASGSGVVEHADIGKTAAVDDDALVFAVNPATPLELCEPVDVVCAIDPATALALCEPVDSDIAQWNRVAEWVCDMWETYNVVYIFGMPQEDATNVNPALLRMIREQGHRRYRVSDDDKRIRLNNGNTLIWLDIDDEMYPDLYRGAVVLYFNCEPTPRHEEIVNKPGIPIYHASSSAIVRQDTDAAVVKSAAKR